MMKWHKEGKRYNPKKIVHTSEGEAWKSFDIKYPEEAAEAGNVRIAITGDGFNPYGWGALCSIVGSTALRDRTSI